MLIPAARVNKFFGNDGGLMLTLYPIFPADFHADTPLFVHIDALDVPLFCERFERRGVRSSWVQFADIDTERRAAELVGKELFIEELEGVVEDEDNTFYMEDLIGFRATGEGLSGNVTDYYDSEINPLLEVTSDEGRAILIPAVEEFIVHIDFKKRAIKLVLPDGLIDL